MNNNDYSDIIDLDRPRSAYKPMPRINRAAQFAPFASLTGYGEVINETGRRVDKKIELSEDEISSINEKLDYLKNYAPKDTEVTIVFFVADGKKVGGTYKKMSGVIKKISPEEGFIEFTDLSRVMLPDIKSVYFPQTDHLF